MSKQYQLIFHKIQCDLPSSGINISAAQATQEAGSIISQIGSGASKVAAGAGSEAQAAAYVVQLLGVLTETSAKVVSAVDKLMRDRGREPDQFYISRTSNPASPQSGENHPDQVLWPSAGKSPRDTYRALAKGASVSTPALSLSEGQAAVLWDWDLGNRTGRVQGDITKDDVLFTFRANASNLGRHTGSYYNARQDCAYTIDWELS